MPNQATVVSADGTPIAYRVSGSGPSLVLLHGAAVGGDCWSRVSPILAERFATVVIDRRGRGASGDAPGYAVEREVEDVRAVIAALSGPAHLIGHSSGGLLALEVARVAPAIGRVVAYEPPVLVKADPAITTLAARLRALAAAGEREAAVRLFFREGPRLDDTELEMIDRSPLWAGAVAVAHTLANDVELAGRFDAASAISTPTLVLCGDASPAWVREGSELLSEALPRGRLALLPGQKHGALWTAPALLSEVSTAFLMGEPG